MPPSRKWIACVAGLLLFGHGGDLPTAAAQSPAPDFDRYTASAPASFDETPESLPPTEQGAATEFLAADASALAEPATNPYAGDLSTRLRMTGDWGGRRSALTARGLTFDLFSTQFYQGVARGGRRQEFEYGGKLDYLSHVDGQKLGLWQGFFVDLHGETRYGTDVNSIDGLLAPANLPMNFPTADANITSLTGVKITQALSEKFAVFLGKINTADEYGFRYSPGLGSSKPGMAGFMNTSLVFNPIVGRTIPYSAAGVGFAALRNLKPFVVLSIFDPEERATTGLEDLYARGAVIVPDITFDVAPLGFPGKYNFGGTWSSASYRSFDPAAYIGIPPLLILNGAVAPRETGSWSLYSNFYQALFLNPHDPQRHWGLFGQFGLSDGNPNPVRFIANGGLGGRSLLPRRAYDTWGAGYFYLGLSDTFKSLAQPLLPQRDEYGVELFYNVAVRPWARLTFDLQVARPSTAAFSTAIIPGMRLQLAF